MLSEKHFESFDHLLLVQFRYFSWCNVARQYLNCATLNRTRTWLFSLPVCLTSVDAHFLIMFGNNSFGGNLFSNIPAFSHRLCSHPLMPPDVILSPFHKMKTYWCNRTYFASNIIDKHWNPFELWLIQHQWCWTIGIHSLMIFYVHGDYTVISKFSLLKFCHCHNCCNSRLMSTREMIFQKIW